MTEKNAIVTHPDYQSIITLEDTREYPELLACIDYLLMKDSEDNLSMEEIALKLHERYGLPVTRQGLYYVVEKWRQNETMDKAQRVYIAPKVEEMRAAVGRAITKMPKILDRLVTDALDPERSTESAIKILTLVNQLAQGQIVADKTGSLERKFAQSSQRINPIEIPED